MRHIKMIALFSCLMLFLTIIQGCKTLRPSVKADVNIPGQDISYVFRGVREGPSSYEMNSRSYSPKAGYRFYTVFVSLNNQMTNKTVVDFDNFVLFDQNDKFYFPALVYLNEFQGMENPFLAKMIETNQTVSAGLIYILTMDSSAETFMLPTQVEIKLPAAPRKEQ